MIRGERWVLLPVARPGFGVFSGGDMLLSL
jgi:hypothetical protein